MSNSSANFITVAALAGSLLLFGKKALALFKKKVASEKLDISFSGLQVKNNLNSLLSLNPKLQFEISFKVNNPSDQELRFTKPYLKVFAINGDKEAQIANSVVENKEIAIAPRSSQLITQPIEATAMNLISAFPQPIQYFISRLVHKMPSTRKFRIEYELDSEGITSSDSFLVNV